MTSSLFTDLYELTMAASYHRHGLDRSATFELFVRSLPERRNFLVACGQEDVVAFLEGLSFGAEELAYLASLDLFRSDFIDYLGELRFTGDVRAVPEGEVVFATEPIVEVTAPLIEAQLAETFLINTVASQTMVASKAARVAIACGGRPFVDFSARRDHGVDAAMQAARAAVIAGAAGTSLVAAGHRFGLELSGTMAHSYVMAFTEEREAFRAYARDFPDNAVLLLDTYDTIEGARHAADVAVELAAEGISIRGVRLDSGDLAGLAKQVRAILDDAGLPEIRILASGDLDEDRVAALLATAAPIDAFGVGTRMGVSEDAPSLGAVYKLVEDAHGPKLKLSEGKSTLPGRKQVWRFADHDVLALDGEPMEGGRPLLVPAMKDGTRIAAHEPVPVLADRCRRAVAALPDHVRGLAPVDDSYEVRLSAGIVDLTRRLTEERD
ncbi:MAG: nicotinate phosphoribosyltransferase [Acidimicrobiales bacterium]